MNKETKIYLKNLEHLIRSQYPEIQVKSVNIGKKGYSGFYCPEDKIIELSNSSSTLEKLLVLAHEMGHHILHKKNDKLIISIERINKKIGSLIDEFIASTVALFLLKKLDYDNKWFAFRFYLYSLRSYFVKYVTN